MAIVTLRAPLSDLAGAREHALPGTTVREVLAALEQRCPGIGGWVLDELGAIRRHVNVYVNGHIAGEGTPVGADDRVRILPAITGG
jgi:sulfur-carrier protein